MAGRSYGGHQGAEFGERKSSNGFPKRDLARVADDRIRNGSRLYDRDIRDRGRVRRRVIKEMEARNGDHRSSATGSDSGASEDGGPRRCGQSARIVDREPGELSSESGSDCAVESDSQVKDVAAVKLDIGTQSSPFRKRKFSPIVWDVDDREARGLKVKTVSTTSSPTPPLLPETNNPSSDALSHPNDNSHVSPVNHQNSGGHQKMDNALSDDTGNLLDQSSYDQRLGNHEEIERLEDEDYITTRNISSSRWAGDANSPADEGEIFADEDMPRGMKIPASKSLEARLSKRSSAPGLVEVKNEPVNRDNVRSLDPESGTFSRPSSGDGGSENKLGGDDVMEMDEEPNKSATSPSRSDTDSGDRISSPGTPETPVPPQRTVNMLQGCRSVDEFERLNKIDEGTYGVVYRARDKKTGEVVALKKVKMEKEREGFPLTSLREINILLSFHHPSIVDVKEVVIGSSLDSIFMVMEYMEHDLKALMETMKQPFSQSEVKCLMLQLLDGISYLHDNWVLHRDLKTSNLLLNNRGELKICDFGLARQYGSPLKPYTHLVVTLWYRAPELLLGAKQYSTAIDMWSLGCIMAELLSKEPLFNGKSEFDQLDKIFRILGTPSEAIWPGFSKLPGVKVNFVKHQYNQLRKKFPATSFTGSPVLSDAGFDLLNKLLTYDPEKRITAEQALRHEWFHEVPLPKSKEFMPTFPAQHAQDRRMRRVLKSPDPLEEQRKRELHQAEFGTGGLFG